MPRDRVKNSKNSSKASAVPAKKRGRPRKVSVENAGKLEDSYKDSALYFDETWRAVREDRLNITLQTSYKSETLSEAKGKEVYLWRDISYHRTWEHAFKNYLADTVVISGKMVKDVNLILSRLNDLEKHITGCIKIVEKEYRNRKTD